MMGSEVDHIITNIAAIRIAMLTTCGMNTNLHSRPMFTLQVDDKDRLWFYTRKNTLKVDEIHSYQQVNLAYADINSHTYISLSGRAQEVDDQQKKKELWDPALSAWFPEGHHSEDVCLLVVEMEEAAYWDSQNSVMKMGIRFEGFQSIRAGI